MNEPIDVVFTWVDDDAEHRRKRAQWSGDIIGDADEIAANTRFTSVGEIFFSVASVLRFAPFIRRIYIVTDNQTPPMEEFVARNKLQTKTEIRIIDHREIFRGYEQYLPTFNSLSIETMLWRIPDLSERAVYMNDDVLLLRPIEEDFWFDGNKIVIRNGKWKVRAIDRLLDSLTPSHTSNKRFSFRGTLYNASMVAGEHWRYFRSSHTPHPFLRSVFEQFYALHPEQLVANIEHRFRHCTQYNLSALSYVLALKQGKAELKDTRTKAFYMKPVGRCINYVEHKIEFQRHNNPATVCINSLDMATEADKKRINDYLTEIIIGNTDNK